MVKHPSPRPPLAGSTDAARARGTSPLARQTSNPPERAMPLALPRSREQTCVIIVCSAEYVCITTYGL
jgi:hypothetical protein